MQESKDIFSMIRCNVANQVYGLAMEYIRSIEQTERVRWAEKNGRFAGNLHTTHETIPVLDLGRRLGSQLTGAPEDQRLVVLEGKRPFALLVDEVSPTLLVRPEQCFPMPTAVIDDQNDFFEGLVQFSDRFVPLLAPTQLHPDAQPRPHPLPVPPTSRQKQNGSIPDYQPQLVAFSVPNMPSSFSLALSLSQVPEIMELPSLTPIPHAPSMIMGLINWHRLPVPVLDLGRYWQPERPITDFEELRLMIVRTAVKDLHLGLLVNPNVRLLRLPLPHRPLPPSLDPHLVRGSIESDGEQLIIPNMLHLLHAIRRKTER